jgi:DNA-binding MltR family transcriptional regulator
LVHEDLTSDERINKDGFNFHGIIREENSGFKNLKKEMEHNFITQAFTDEEWLASSDIIAFSLSCSLLEMNSNCLKLVESLSGLDVRIKELQKKVSLHLLLSCMGKKEFTDVKQIMDLLTSFNMKDKQTDFIRMYICLALADV